MACGATTIVYKTKNVGIGIQINNIAKARLCFFNYQRDTGGQEQVVQIILNVNIVTFQRDESDLLTSMESTPECAIDIARIISASLHTMGKAIVILYRARWQPFFFLGAVYLALISNIAKLVLKVTSG